MRLDAGWHRGIREYYHYGCGMPWSYGRECCEAVTEAAFLGLQEKRPGTEMAREREGTIFFDFGSRILIGA